jgi:hypothetical protein
MSLRTSLATLLILFSSAGVARERSRPVESLPQAVLPHPIADNDRSLEAAPRWSPQALAEWGGPWVEHPGPYPPLYDHRYITW